MLNTDSSQRPITEITLAPAEKRILHELFPQGVVAFDLEMTGLTPVVDKIIEIAAIKVDADANVSTFHQLINPLVPISEESTKFHNITNEIVANQPSIRGPLKDFVDFFKHHPLIAHNARFDAAFLVKSMYEFNISFSLSDIYDSCLLNRTFFKKNTSAGKRPESFKLFELAKFYNFDFTPHRAMDDAFIALKVFAQCALLLEKKNKEGPEKKQRPSLQIKDMSFLFKLNSFQKREEYIVSKKHLPLLDHTRNRDKLMITYQGGSHKNTVRPIVPISVLHLPTGMALYALCLLDDKHKYFKLKKIKTFKKADKS